jgi:hypothetical protein
MKYPRAALSAILVLTLFALGTLSSGFAQASPPPLPAAADLYPNGIDTGSGLPALVTDSGLGGTPRLTPRLADPSLPSGPPVHIADKELRIEALALLPLGQSYAQLSPKAIIDELGAILCSVETLTGLEYWSASRGKMRPLYESAYKIDDESSRKPVNAPASVEVAALEPGRSLEFLAFQKDTSFGANVYRYALRRGDKSLSLESENLTVMRYLMIPFVSSGKMRSRLWAIPCREGLLLYFVTTIESVNFAVERIFESAGNRALALLGWMSIQAEKAGLSGKIELPVNMKSVGAGEP